MDFILWFKIISTEYIPIFQVIMFQKRHVQAYRALTTGHAQWMTVYLHVLARTIFHTVSTNYFFSINTDECNKLTRLVYVYVIIKWKIKKIHTVRTVSKSNRKIKKILHRRNSFKISWLGTGTSIKCSGVKQVLRANISPLSEMMRLCKCFPMWVKCKLSNITVICYICSCR